MSAQLQEFMQNLYSKFQENQKYVFYVALGLIILYLVLSNRSTLMNKIMYKPPHMKQLEQNDYGQYVQRSDQMQRFAEEKATKMPIAKVAPVELQSTIQPYNMTDSVAFV